MVRRAVLTLAVLWFAGCAAHQPKVPANVTFGIGPAPARPLVAASEAAPRILAIRFSAEKVRRGQTWSGYIITSTNVASVEVRTNLYSIDVPRRSFGEFAFALHVLDVPPIFIRAYAVRVIARNAAGKAVEEDIPFRIL